MWYNGDPIKRTQNSNVTLENLGEDDITKGFQVNFI